MAIISKIALISVLGITVSGERYIRPSTWRNSFEQLFGRKVDEALLAKIEAEINDFAADGGEVIGEALGVSFDEHELIPPADDEEDEPEGNLLEAALGDGGARARAGKGKGEGGEKKKKRKNRGRKPKKPAGEKYEYSVASDDHVATPDKPVGPPLKGIKKKMAMKITMELMTGDHECYTNCEQYCHFGKADLNAQHEPCRKCQRTECLTEIKELFGGKRRKKNRRPKNDEDAEEGAGEGAVEGEEGGGDGHRPGKRPGGKGCKGGKGGGGRPGRPDRPARPSKEGGEGAEGAKGGKKKRRKQRGRRRG